ncbi:PIN/TRAM domain-containing protein, partial [Staphylococcus epidermidis]
MKVLKGSVIIIDIILGASFGIMLIPEILNDVGMNTPPIYANHYIDGLVGMIVFFLIFGLFINKVTRLLKEAEMWIMKRSA